MRRTRGRTFATVIPFTIQVACRTPTTFATVTSTTSRVIAAARPLGVPTAGRIAAR